jgi:large subunit ribosomal protein L30
MAVQQQVSRSEPKASEDHQVKMISVRWVKSQIGFDQRQRATIRGLGLRRLNQSVQLQDTPAVRGMIFKVRHLVVVEEA